MPPEHLQQLFDEAPCGFLSFTDDGKVVVVNHTLLGLLGYERQEVLARSVEEILPLASRIFCQTHFFPLVKLRGRADEIYLALRSKSGGDVATIVNAVRRSRADVAVTDCAVFPVDQRRKYEDALLAARREAEAALETKEALARELQRALNELQAAQVQLVQEEKLASLGRLAAAVAHEVKNPLNFIINFAGLIERAVPALRDSSAVMRPSEGLEVEDKPAGILDDMALNARRIGEHGRRIDAIVRRLMDHAHARPADRSRLVDVNRLVEEQLARFLKGRKMEVAGLTVDVTRTFDEMAGAVVGAPHELGLMLQSLLNNAVDALAERNWRVPGRDGSAPPHPALMVLTRRRGREVDIEVSDNGLGIPEAHRAQLFEPFFSTKRTGKGHVGLGLSLAHEVAKGHGGGIRIRSPDSGGATVVVGLPAR